MIISIKESGEFDVNFDRIVVPHKSGHYGLYVCYRLLLEAPNILSCKFIGNNFIYEINPIGRYSKSDEFVKKMIEIGIVTWEISFYAYGQKITIAGNSVSSVINLNVSEFIPEIKSILCRTEIIVQKDIKKISTVFISGSKNISCLDTNVVNHLNNIIEQKFDIIIGDCSGVDQLIQDYLYKSKYPYVAIYYVGQAPRNNIGDWPAINIPIKENNLSPFEFYSKKDEKMSQICDSGFVIWDMQSKGSKNNIIRLKQMNKLIIVYDNIAHKIKKY